MSCVHEFSLRMHTLVSNHASPASKLCSQDMRIACSARMCGRPAAAPYPGLRRSAVRQCERGESAAVHCPSVRPCKRGEPVAVPYPGVRPRKRGRPAHALLACAAGLRRHLIPASGRPPCGSVSAAGRRLYIAPACGRASAASLRPYLIPACVRASAAGLRPYLIPASGRVSAAGRRLYMPRPPAV